MSFTRLGVITTALAVLALAAPARAQVYLSTSNIALKNGETTEFSEVYFISAATCKSMLKGTPKVEILDGPPGVSIEFKQAMVVPRYYNCAKPVSGGKLLISAQGIEDESRTPMTLRFT